MADKLTQEQIEECKEIFDLFDSDEDGYIATEDVVTALRSLGQNFNEADAQRMMKDVTSAGSTIEFTSFLSLASRKMHEEISEEQLLEAFGVFDDDQNGVIPADQLRHVMSAHGDRLTDEEVDEMIRKADVRGDERIDYREFVKVLMAK